MWYVIAAALRSRAKTAGIRETYSDIISGCPHKAGMTVKFNFHHRDE
jgi:hypothetical protein